MNKYRPDIDGLRALAVVSVILNHFFQSWMPSGFLGVDIFFVISGFVITGSLSHYPESSWKDYVFKFYSKRIKRLFPALVFCVLATVAVAAAFQILTRDSVRTGIWALFGASNIRLYLQSTDYFAASTKLNLFTHTWSLGVEEQFYLFFPILAGWLGFSRIKSPNGAKQLALVTSLIIVFSILLNVYFRTSHPSAVFFGLPFRAYELGFGCLAYLILNPVSKPVKESRALEFLRSVSILAIVALLFSPQAWSTWTTFSISFLTASLLFLGSGQWIIGRLLSFPKVVTIGLLSYSLYLWHWSVLVISRILCKMNNWDETNVGIVCAQFFSLILLSVFSYYFIEKKFRYLNWGSSEKVLSVGLATVVAGVGLLNFVKPENKLLYTGGNFLLVEKCHLPTVEDPIESCLSAASGSKSPKVILMGDSHAGNLVPAIRKIQTDLGFEFRFLTDRAFYIHLFGEDGCGGTHCSKNELGLRLDYLSKTVKKGDVFVFSMSRDRLYDSSGSIYFNEEKMKKDIRSNLNVFEQNLGKVAEVIQTAGAKILLVRDIPKTCAYEDFDLWNSGQLHLCVTAKEKSLRHRAPLDAIYDRLALKNDAIQFIDLHDQLCPSKICSNFLNNSIIFSDGSPHLSFEASEMLAPQMKAFLKPLLGNHNKNI